MGFILVYVTYPNMEEANKAISFLLKNKLIACSNSFSVKATSCWTGKIEECDEIVSILKTKKENWEIVRSEVKKMHSYKVPCIMKLDVQANKEYEDWVESETNK
jgi:periplasmic divalent cation tolerance protein